MLWQWHEPVEQNVLGEEDEILNHLSGKQEPLNIFTDTLQNKPGRTQVIEHAVHMVT